MVDCPGMGIYLDKMEDTKVTNVLKLVYGWQNDGQQKTYSVTIMRIIDARLVVGN